MQLALELKHAIVNPVQFHNHVRAQCHCFRYLDIIQVDGIAAPGFLQLRLSLLESLEQLHVLLLQCQERVLDPGI